MLKPILDYIKTVVFEKSRITYYLNLPGYRTAYKKIEQKPKKSKIRIGFICQEPSIWLSFGPVYEAALKDESVEPYLIAVPQMTYAFYIKVMKIDYEEVYKYANGICENYVPAYDPVKKEWFDIKKLDLDYVFVPRPYETYLPKGYKALNLSRHAKVCHIPYGYMTSDMNDCANNTHFIRNVYMVFCENTSTYNYVRRKVKGTVKRGEQKVLKIGFPRFDLVVEGDRSLKGIWKRDRNDSIHRVVWTPRWTPNPKLGGSNFLKYKDIILDYVLEHTETMDLVFRPHPLTFEAFKEAGLLTEADQKDYLKKYEQSVNAVYDCGSEYLDTFYASDILITDCSSVMVDYLFTKKPIILCPAYEIYADDMSDLLECFYIVHSGEELKSILEQLLQGKDPKREYREKYIKEMKPDYNVSEKIIETIKDDYWK